MSGRAARWLQVLCLALLAIEGGTFSGRSEADRGSGSVSIDASGDIALGPSLNEVAKRPRSNRLQPRQQQQSRPQQRQQQERQHQQLQLPYSSLIELQALASDPSENADKAAESTVDKFKHSAAGLANKLHTIKDFVHGHGGHEDDDGIQGCLSDSEGHSLEPLSEMERWGEYRISGPSVGKFVGNMAVFSDKGCQNEISDLDVNVTRFPNNTDIMHRSWLAVRIGGASPPNNDVYVCGTVVGSKKRSCFAKIGALGRMQKINWSKANLADDRGLILMGLAFLLVGLAFALSLLHAGYLIATMPAPGEKHTLRGLGTTSVLMLAGNAVLKGSMFILGIDSMASVGIRSCLADAPWYVVDGIFYSSVLLSFLGMLRMMHLLYSAQLYEVALLQGKCVLPDFSIYSGVHFGQSIAFALTDALVIFAFGLFSMLTACGFAFVANETINKPGGYEDFLRNGVGCWHSFPALLQTIIANMVRHTLQNDGLCRAKLRSLTSERHDEEPTATLLEHLQVHPKVEISMGHFCQTCRQGQDPLDEIDVNGKDPGDLPSGPELRLRDVSWHARYIYKKTGSRATACSMPICLGLLLVSLFRSIETRVFYMTAVPTLDYAVPSQGRLVPDFESNIREYTMYYPAHVTSVSLLNEGDDILARTKEFVFTGQEGLRHGAKEEPMYPMSLHEQEHGYPYDLVVNVNGGPASEGRPNHVTTYRIAMARMMSVVTTFRFTSGDWSRCVYMTPLREGHIAFPDNLTNVSVEVSTLLHIEGIPISLHEWQHKSSDPGSPLASQTTAVFQEVENPGEERCRQACIFLALDGCLLSHSCSRGCYYVMVKKSQQACDNLHLTSGRTIDAVAPSAKALETIDKLYNDTEANMTLCRGRQRPCRNNKAFAELVPTARRYMPVAIPLEKSRHNLVTYTWFTKSRHQATSTDIFTRVMHLWSGAPGPDDILVVPQRGLSVEKVEQADDTFHIKIHKFEFNQISGPLRFLIIARLGDWDFKVEFPATLKRWKFDPNNTEFDVEGHCRNTSTLSPLRFLSVCSQQLTEGNIHTKAKDQWEEAVIVELDPLFPKRIVVGTVAARPDSESRDIPSNDFTVVFDASDYPAVWAFQDRQKGHCELSTPHRTAQENYQMLWEPAVYEACKCEMITLIAREGSATFTPKEFFIWNLRSSLLPKYQVSLLDLFMTKLPDLVMEALDADLEGLFPTTAEVCTPNFKRNWEPSYKLTWETIFIHSNVVDKIVCSKGHGKIAPRFIAQAILGISGEEKRDMILRVLRKCSEMPSPPATASSGSFDQRQWTVAATSPIAAAISVREDEILDLLLEKYGQNYTVVSVPSADETGLPGQLGYLELVVAAGCRACLASVTKLMERMRQRCAGEEAKSVSCQTFEEQHRWLDLGNQNFGSDEHVMDVLNLTSHFAQTVDFRTVEMDLAGLSNSRFSDLLPLWQSAPNLHTLDMSVNNIDLCESEEEQVTCTWKGADNMMVASPADDARDVYASLSAAQEACAKTNKAFCKRISCNQTGQCKAYFFSDSSIPEKPSSGSIVYEPTKGCYEERLFDFLTTVPKLKILNVAGNLLCHRGTAQIARALTSITQLERADFGNTGITGGNEAVLSSLSSSLGQLLRLNISNNDDLGPVGLAKIVPGKSLQSLSMADVGLNYRKKGDFEEVAKRLAEFPELRTVELGGNDIGQGIKELLPAFRSWRKLEHMDISFANLTGDGLKELLLALPVESLKVLRLAGNSLRNEGLVVKDLLKFKRLEVLDLHKTQVGDTDLATFLWRYTSLNTGLPELRELYLHQNRLGKKSITSLLGAKHPKLSVLHVGWNKMKKKDVSAKDLANAAHHLESLGLSGYELGLSRFASRLANGKNFTLKRLYLDNGLRVDDIRRRDQFNFLQTQSLPDMEFLDVSNSNLTKQAMKDLFIRSSEVPHLKELVLYGNVFHKEDWPFHAAAFPDLEMLEGDFSPCDLQTLRHYLPRTRIVSSIE